MILLGCLTAGCVLVGGEQRTSVTHATSISQLPTNLVVKETVLRVGRIRIR